jgi:AhpD family alkylhydroperoxidase
MSAFSQLASATMKDGAMPKKTKELMAVAISVAIRCEGCIVYHTQAAIKAGASREEFLETLNVSIELGGGPATVYGAKALAAFEQLST